MNSKRRKKSDDIRVKVDNEEKSIEQDEYNVYFSRISIPLEILLLILSFLQSNRSLLENFGVVNKTIYFQIRLNWNEIVKVTRTNIKTIPTVLIKGIKKLWLSESFSKTDVLRILMKLNPRRLNYLSFKASKVKKTSSINQFFLSVIKKENLVFSNCQHLVLCYGVREDVSEIIFDFMEQFPNLTTIESPAKINSSLMTQLPKVRRILHGMTRKEVLSFLEMMESEFPEKCKQIVYFHRNCVREVRTSFEISRYGRESPYKQVWGARQLKEPELGYYHLEKTVEVFTNLERLDLSYTRNITYWEKEGIKPGEKLKYHLNVTCTSNLMNLTILNLSAKYESEIFTCSCSFPDDLRNVKSMNLSNVPYSLYFEHFSSCLRDGKWRSLKKFDVSFNTGDHSDYFEMTRYNDVLSGEVIFFPSKLSAKFVRFLNDLMRKSDFPANLECMKITFSSILSLEITTMMKMIGKGADERSLKKKKKKVMFRVRGLEEEDGVEKFVFNQLILERNVRDESNEKIILEVDQTTQSTLGMVSENVKDCVDIIVVNRTT